MSNIELTDKEEKEEEEEEVKNFEGKQKEDERSRRRAEKIQKKKENALLTQADRKIIEETPNAPSTEEEALANAYKELYIAQASKDLAGIQLKQENLQSALKTAGIANMAKNKANASDLANKRKADKVAWIDLMISDTKTQIAALELDLQNLARANVAAPVIADLIKSEVKEQGSGKTTDLVSVKYSGVEDKWADPRKSLIRTYEYPAETDHARRFSDPTKWRSSPSSTAGG